MISVFRRSLLILIIAAFIICSGVSICMAESEPEADPSGEAAKEKTLKVKSVKYNPEKSVVTFKFNQLVTYKKTKAVIKFKNGNNMVIKIKKYGPDYVRVKVKKLKYGRKYTYKLTGIRKFGYINTKTLTGTFRAIDN